MINHNLQVSKKDTTYALEAEKAIIANILLECKNIEIIEDILIADDFFDKKHRVLYSKFLDLNQQNVPFDSVVVCEILATEGKLEDAGGNEYIIDIVTNIQSIANIKSYAEIIKDKAKLRKLKNNVNDIFQKIYSSDSIKPDEVIDYAERKILDISKERDISEKSLMSIKEVIPKVIDRMDSIMDSGSDVTGTPTGFIDLDKMTSGLHPSNLCIIAARPSMGKTVLGVNIAENVAKVSEKPVLIFSLEMPAEDIVLRMLASLSKVEMTLLRECNKLNDTHWSRITQAMKTLTEMNIYIDDTSTLTPAEMRSRARRIYNEHNGLSLVLIDYLQLMKIPGYETNRTLEVSEISRSLKALSKELHVPVISLSQLNRNVDDRKDKRPMMSDLRESGAIEQDADVIMFIYRDEVYNKDNEEVKGIGEIIIGKQRNGPIGTVHVKFDGQYARFTNLSNENDYLIPGDMGYNE